MKTEDIFTPRLALRSTREEWGPLCLSIWLDEEMGRYLSDPPREKASEKYLRFAGGIEEDEAWYPFTVFSQETGALVGTCSVVPENGVWDLGYCIHRDYWRQGYGTEMVQALIDWGRREGVHTFTAEVAKENAASVALARKLGFFVEKEGSFRKQGTDLIFPAYTFRLDLK